MTLTNAHPSSSPAISEASRLTSSYEPRTATSEPPYTAVIWIFAGSRSCGMKTTVRMPARAPAAATAFARLPVEGQANTFAPSSRAAESAIATTRSLKEWVGLPESSLTHRLRTPTSRAEVVGAQRAG